MIKIRQSYHGIGGKEGYRYNVYNSKGRKLGELKNLPVNCGIGDVVRLNGELFIITKAYDSDNPRHEKTEVVFYELEPYVFKPDFDLGVIIKANHTKNNNREDSWYRDLIHEETFPLRKSK